MCNLIRIFCLTVCLWPISALALVNINTASLDELDTLPGVGPSTASKIVSARPFSSASEIQNVQGIGGPGSKTYEDIIGLITVSGSTVVPKEEEEVTVKSSSDSDTKTAEKKVYLPVAGLVLYAPDIAYVNQAVSFKAEPKSGTNDRLVRYTWNFGDGNTSEQSNPKHTYRYPGQYIVIVESYYLKETKIARHEIEVLPVSISVKGNSDGSITLKNNGDEEVDLVGMSVGDFVFPKYSFLMAGESITISPSVSSYVALYDQMGEVVATPASEPRAHSPASPSKATVVKSETVIESTIDDSETLIGPVAEASEGNLQTATAVNSGSKDEYWPYLGLLVLIGFGFLSLFSFKN